MDELFKALVRMNAALAVLVMGPPDARHEVERLVDGKLEPDEAKAVRDRLDAVADRLWKKP